MTLNGLMTLYNAIAPVSTSAGVSSAIEWLYEVEVYAMEHREEVPNANSIIFACEDFANKTPVLSTDYTTLNNNLYHVRSMIYAVIQNHLEPTVNPSE